MAKIKIVNSTEFRKEFKKTIESSNINILLGAGFSYGICDTLGNTEKLMEAVNQYDKANKYSCIEAWLFWDFFKRTILPLKDKDNDKSLSNQIEFVNIWKRILIDRESAVINKQVNVFTTNYDIVLEYAFETTYTDYNDGFKGRMNPYFSTTNFNRIYFEKALFTNRTVEVPIFNLLKLHGSVSWNIEDIGERKIVYNDFKKVVENFYQCEFKFFEKNHKKLFNNLELDLSLLDYRLPISEDELDKILPARREIFINKCNTFTNKFKERFKIVSPTKQKFSDTLMDKNYYELMRIYSNELEKNNTLLITFGFSFDDEHIEEITKRSLGNPSLIIVIFAYSGDAVFKYKEKFRKYENVWIVRNPIVTEVDAKEGIVEEKFNLIAFNNCLDDIFGDK